MEFAILNMVIHGMQHSQGSEFSGHHIYRWMLCTFSSRTGGEHSLLSVRTEISMSMFPAALQSGNFGEITLLRAFCKLIFIYSVPTCGLWLMKECQWGIVFLFKYLLFGLLESADIQEHIP